MVIDIMKLKTGQLSSINIDSDVTLSKEQLSGTSIIDIENLHVECTIIKDLENEYYIDGKLFGTLILPDSITLKPVKTDFETEIQGNIEELLEEIGENIKKTPNSIDIFPILWENILMEIPIRVVDEESSNIKLEGNGWKLVRDDETTSVNPELLKLSDLLKEEVL